MLDSDAQSAIDEKYMAEALSLAAKGSYTTTPNPRVGCVIVAGCGQSNEKIVGRGWHKRAGEAHAEIVALRDAGDQARGATVYVTLEPCCVSGQTGPCTEALIKAGVARVVYAVSDPNPEVNGRGESILLEADIAVTSGVLGEQAAMLNKGFIKRMRSGLPWVVAKTASSLDGRSAMASGESKWITGAVARTEVQHLRAQSCAIITGVGTVLADNPSLNVRPEDFGGTVGRQPALVIVDSQLRTPADAALFSASAERRKVVIATTQEAFQKSHFQQDHFEQGAFENSSAELLAAESDQSGRVCLHSLLEELAVRNMNEVLVECGPELLGGFLQAGVVDELAAFIAPKLMGVSALPMANISIDKLSDAIQFELCDAQRLGEDVLLRYMNSASKSGLGV